MATQKTHFAMCTSEMRCRWSDLELILSDFARMRSSDSVLLLTRSFCFCVFAPGMNLNKRELNEHVEFESQTYYAAFAAELEACAQPMWGLLTHCKVKVSPVFPRSAILDALPTMIFGAFSPNIKAVTKVGGAVKGIIITIAGTG